MYKNEKKKIAFDPEKLLNYYDDSKVLTSPEKVLYQDKTGLFGPDISNYAKLYSKNKPNNQDGFVYNPNDYKKENANYVFDPEYNYMQGMTDDIDKGDFLPAWMKENQRNAKIDAGYGNGYQKTNIFNYAPKYQDKIARLRSKLENKEEFDYNPEDDASYKYLRKIYAKNAKDTMSDTLGKIASANGGRLSANATTAASLAYQDKMNQLEGEIPALREIAYGRYTDDLTDTRNLMNDYINQEADNYGKWNDNLNKILGFSEYEHNRELDKFNREYQSSVAIGYITKGLSELTGIPEGTPTENAKEFLMDLNKRSEQYDKEIALNIMNALGYFPKEYVKNYGIDNLDDAYPTLSRQSLNQDNEQFHIKYGDNGAGDPKTGSGVISEEDIEAMIAKGEDKATIISAIDSLDITDEEKKKYKAMVNG